MKTNLLPTQSQSNEVIFVPANKQDIHVAEFDIDDVFSKISSYGKYVIFNHENCVYPVNMGSDRYKLLSSNRRCVCCGVVGNRLFLDYNEEYEGWHFNLYAETRDNPNSKKVHMVCMTRDHIIPKSSGGSDDLSNLQTMCYLCNVYKERTNLSIETVQKSLFLSYRIYKNTFAINKTRERNEALYEHLAKNQKLAKNLKAGMEKVRSDIGRQAMQDKFDVANSISQRLSKKIEQIELNAQITGEVYNHIENIVD